jgi:hypothetical protein
MSQLKIGDQARIKEDCFTRRKLYESQGRLSEYKSNFIDRETELFIGTIVTIKTIESCLARGVDFWGKNPYCFYRDIVYIEEDGGKWAWRASDFEPYMDEPYKELESLIKKDYLWNT